MAITYTVKAGRAESGGYSKGTRKDSLRQSWNQDFLVEVTDPADSGFNPAFISTFEMLAGATVSSPGLPIVDNTVFFDPGTFTGVAFVIPFLQCRAKTAQRSAANPGLWTVATQWDSGDAAIGTTNANGEVLPIPPPLNVDAYPARIESATGQVRRKMWVDSQGVICELPSGNQFAEPFYETRGTQVKRVTQYETGTTLATIALRMQAVNSDGYSGDPPGQWKIKDIENTNVNLYTLGGTAAAVEIEYTLERSPFAEGWVDHRALVDTHFLDAANDVSTTRPFYDQRLEAQLNKYSQEDGTALPAATPPEYRDFSPFAQISFAFLKG